MQGFGSIGEFGVSSDLTWGAGFGPGQVINDELAAEFFYRILSIDYEGSPGFVFDATLHGLFLGLVIKR